MSKSELKRGCKQCGKILIIKKTSLCDNCRYERDRIQRKEAMLRYRSSVANLPKNRICKKCGEIADHFKGQNTCKDCHRAYVENRSVKIKPVRIEDDLPSSDLFWSLMQKAQNNPGIKNRKVRQSTVDRTLEVELTRNCNLIGEL